MATLDTETADALSVLLEDERASVEIEVALSEGATEIYERDAFDVMASADVLGCCALRETLEEASVPVTRLVSGVALHILGVDTYDERLLAFAHHQESIRRHAQLLLASMTDRETMRVLQDIADAHTRFEGWCEQRAREFAESRLLAFAGNTPSGAEVAPPDGMASATPSTTIADTTLMAMQDAALACGPDTPDTGKNGPDAKRDAEDAGSAVDPGTSGTPGQT